MSEPGPRVAAWLGTISDLLGERLYEMPHQVILEQLARTFSVTAVAHSSSDSSGHQQMLSLPTDVLAHVAELDEWLNGRSHEHHPLIRWHATVRDPRPTTIARVPTAVISVRDRQPLIDGLKKQEIEQQIAIGYRLSGRSHQAYILGRAGTDFTDDDLVVARCVQRALMGLDRHVALLRQLSDLPGAAFDAGLTGREASVLALLAAAHSNSAIARRLDCSPRTVDKHLERIFRKLGVRDKLNAVRVAQAWGHRTGTG